MSSWDCQQAHSGNFRMGLKTEPVLSSASQSFQVRETFPSFHFIPVFNPLHLPAGLLQAGL